MTSQHAADPKLFPDMGNVSPSECCKSNSSIGRCLKLAGSPGWLYQGWDARAGGGHPSFASGPAPYWGEAQLVCLASVHLQRNHWLLCWLLKPWFFAWGRTAARLPWCGAQLSRASGVSGHMLTCALQLTSTKKTIQGILVQCSWYQYNLQPLCLAVLPTFVLSFLMPPLGCWSSISCLLQAGAAATSEDNHVQWNCSIRDGEQRRAGTCQIPGEVILPINRPSKCHMWRVTWLPVLRWHPALVTAALPALSTTPVPPLPREAQSHTAAGGWKASPRAISAFLRSGSLKWT